MDYHIRKYPHCNAIVRKWTPEEEEKLISLKNEGYSIPQCAEILGRTYNSVSVKYKRLRKNNKSYNSPHRSEKNKINLEFVKEINPKSILELYAGAGNPAYINYNITKNDIDTQFECDFHLDALHCLSKLYSENKKYDLIDLDPYGSAFDCFDLAIKMAKKGLCITLGEIGLVRFKQIDFVKLRYNINSIDDFTIINIIKEIQKIGKRNKKELIIYNYKEWHNIGRVWFIVKPYKDSSQWENNEYGNSRRVIKNERTSQITF